MSSTNRAQLQSAGNFGTGPAGEWSGKIGDIMQEMLNRSFFRYSDKGSWQPATNVYESDACYHVCVELAGVDRAQICVECPNPRLLVIHGSRANPQPRDVCTDVSVHALEIDSGPFRREIELPEAVRVDVVEAVYEKGYLWVTLPKTPR